MFQTTKIQIFESNSQPLHQYILLPFRCFRLQRYKFLKAIHNLEWIVVFACRLFQTTKIQIFESNSQHVRTSLVQSYSCFRLQRYKFLKAIHNAPFPILQRNLVVSDYKDTNFWKQFTTPVESRLSTSKLFQTTKIQIFESNSQQRCLWASRISPCCFRLQRYKLSQSNSQPGVHFVLSSGGCFRLQRYKLLKAIHNKCMNVVINNYVVSDYKDTNFWKQFTTYLPFGFAERELFQTTKIQAFSKQFTTLCKRKLKCFCFFR